MPYVDGFVVPVPKKKLKAYLAMARTAAKVWRDHGALEVRECVADDVKVGKRTSFPRNVGRNSGLLLHRLQVAPATRPHHGQGDERLASRQNDESELHAIRRQAHDFWRLQGSG